MHRRWKMKATQNFKTLKMNRDLGCLTVVFCRKSIPGCLIGGRDRFSSIHEGINFVSFAVQGFARLNRKRSDHTIRNKSLLSGEGRIPILLDQVRYFYHLTRCYQSVFGGVVENFKIMGTEVPHRFQTVPEDGYLVTRMRPNSFVV